MRSCPTRELTIPYRRSIAVVIDIPTFKSPTLARLAGPKEERKRKRKSWRNRQAIVLPRFPRAQQSSCSRAAPSHDQTTSAPPTTCTPVTTRLARRVRPNQTSAPFLYVPRCYTLQHPTIPVHAHAHAHAHAPTRSVALHTRAPWAVARSRSSPSRTTATGKPYPSSLCHVTRVSQAY